MSGRDDLRTARATANGKPEGGVSGVNPPGGDTSDTPVKKGRYDGRILDVGKMLAQPDEAIPWRCDNLAADGYLTVLAGRGGEGKSWMALELAGGVARGKPAAGIECRQGRALIFDAENGPKLTIRRLRSAQVTAGLDVQPVDAGGLTVEKDLDWFRTTITAQGANLVVFDSLRVLSSGAKESDGDVMEPLITALKQLSRDTSAAVVLIHHRGKGEGSEYRGSSVILDQSDMLFTLGRVQGDPEGRTRRKITTIKCRIEEEPAPRWVAIEADRSCGFVFLNEAEPFEPEDGGRPRDALKDDVLAALGSIRQSQAQIARAVGRDPKDQTVRRVLRDLETDGLAVKDAAGWGVSTVAPIGVDTLTPPTQTSMDTGSEGVSGPVDTPRDDTPRQHVDGRPYEPAPDWMPTAKTTGQLIVSSDSNEWYTPALYIDAARTVLGGIDLDPASSAAANETVGADRFYTIHDDGLAQPWEGRVWVNPPYGGLAGGFVAKLVKSYRAGDVTAAICLVNAHCTDTQWFQPLWDCPLCFTAGRIHFNRPGSDKTTSSTHGSVFAYLGPDPEAFAGAFAQFGNVVQR